MTTRQSIVAVAVIAAAAATHCAAEFYTDEPIRSPDGSSEVTLRYGGSMGTEWHISLSRNGRVIRRRFLPDKLDVRYVRASWSPSSRAVLLGEGYHGGMDLTLVRIVGHRTFVRHFDLDDRMVEKEEKELPLRRELQSSAAGDRVAWSTVKWLSPTRCTMLYIIHGFGHEGEGDVTLDFTGRHSVLRTSHLRALAHPEYFNTD